jgi:hypothetical protein
MKGRRRGRGLVNWRNDTPADPKAVERRLKQAMAKLSAPESDRPAHGDSEDDKDEA